MGFELHALRRRAVCLDLPLVSPLDALHNGLGGADAVAELTGRSNILKEDAERGGWISVPRDQPPERDLEDFQMGRKKAAVLSGAMSTGISMHADGVGAPRRCMILFELPWSAEKAMQQIGRVHRSRQESAPEYVLMASNRGFEQRFSSTVGSRLAQLGAIASGDRETLTTSSQLRLRATADLDSAHFVSTRAHEAIVQLFKEPAYYSLFEQMGLDDLNKLTATKFMNRALALPCAASNIMFDGFVDALHEAIAYAEQHGTMSKPVEMITVDHDRVQLTKTLLSPTLGAEIHVFRIDHGLTLADAQAQHDELLARGYDKTKVFFAYVSDEPVLVWHRTNRMFLRFTPLGKTINLHINHLPQAVPVDANFESAWQSVYRFGDGEEPRVVFKRILMLPCLRTLAVLGPSKNIRLAKITYSNGQRTLGVDLGSESSSWIGASTLARHGFATSEDHAERKRRAEEAEAERLRANAELNERLRRERAAQARAEAERALPPLGSPAGSPAASPERAPAATGTQARKATIEMAPAPVAAGGGPAAIPERVLAAVIHEAGGVQVKDLLQRFKTRIGSSKEKQREFMENAAKIATSERRDVNGKSVCFVVLKDETLRKYGLAAPAPAPVPAAAAPVVPARPTAAAAMQVRQAAAAAAYKAPIVPAPAAMASKISPSNISPFHSKILPNPSRSGCGVGAAPRNPSTAADRRSSTPAHGQSLTFSPFTASRNTAALPSRGSCSRSSGSITTWAKFSR